MNIHLSIPASQKKQSTLSSNSATNIRHIFCENHRQQNKGFFGKMKNLNQISDQSDRTISCNYFDTKYFKNIKIKVPSLSILRLNIPSLKLHINDLTIF